MEVQATTKYIRISPSKARDLARAIQGRPVPEALRIVQFSERKAAVHLRKTLKSAVANAENNAKLSADELIVREAVVNEGPIIKRWWPRARGMVSPIKKRTSHIKITLTDGK
jgi:large subunit ribosomal protein L22